MKLRLFKTSLALLLLALAAFAQPAETTAAKNVAVQFYRTYLKLKVDGLPNGKELKLLTPLLSPELQQLIKNAKQKQAKFIKENPTDKPPWVEGDLFSGLSDGAQSYRIGAPVVQGNRAEIPVLLFYREGKDKTQWTDKLILMKTKNGWRISDILYGAAWGIKSDESLRSILKADVE